MSNELPEPIMLNNSDVLLKLHFFFLKMEIVSKISHHQTIANVYQIQQERNTTESLVKHWNGKCGQNICLVIKM